MWTNVGEAHALGDGEGAGVVHQGDVDVVGYQGVVLGLLEAAEGDFLVELEAVGLLGEVEGGVASAAHFHRGGRQGVELGAYAGPGRHGELGGQIVDFVDDVVGGLVGVDVYDGDVGAQLAPFLPFRES